MPKRLADEWKNKLLKEISELGKRYDTAKVFNDFITMVAIGISNAVTRMHFESREKDYFNTIKRYSAADQPKFREMNDYLVTALECSAHDYRDILGEICFELSLTNKDMAQDFSPRGVGLVMAGIGKPTFVNAIEKSGFLRLYEPTVGSGSIALAQADALYSCGYNPSKQLCVNATDLAFKCVCMTYIQLSYYGIPAVVIHGDTLMVKEFSRWYTPVYVIDGWIWRCKGGLTNGYSSDDEMLKCMLDPQYAKYRSIMNFLGKAENTAK